jgi:hypothetical protein
MLQVITGDQADTPITHILTGMAATGGVAIGGIGKAHSLCREPRNLKAKSLS